MKAGALKIKILRAGSGAVVANESAKNLARNKTEAKDLNSLLNSKGIRSKQHYAEMEGLRNYEANVTQLNETFS